MKIDYKALLLYPCISLEIDILDTSKYSITNGAFIDIDQRNPRQQQP